MCVEWGRELKKARKQTRHRIWPKHTEQTKHWTKKRKDIHACWDFDGQKVSDVTGKNSPTMFRNLDKNVGELLAHLEYTSARIWYPLLRFLDKPLTDTLVCLWSLQQISQASKPVIKACGLWGSVKALSRGYEYLMGIVIFVPVAVLAWFPFVSEFQTRLLFNQAFSRGLQISRILAGGKKQR